MPFSQAMWIIKRIIFVQKEAKDTSRDPEVNDTIVRFVPGMEDDMGFNEFESGQREQET